jgi:hypothetical protein
VSFTTTIGCSVYDQPAWTPDGSALVYSRVGSPACKSGVVRQRPGATATMVLKGVSALQLSYTHSGTSLIFLGNCPPDVCNTLGVFKATATGQGLHQVVGVLDSRWDCFLGDICVNGLAVGDTVGWVESGVYDGDDAGMGSETCFDGVVEQPAGTATLTGTPSFCVGTQTSGWDVR